MAWLDFGRPAALVAVLAAGVLAAAATAPARAGVISDTATLPLLGVPYVTSLGFNCFPLAGVCVTGGQFMLTSPVSSIFNATGQDITTGAVFTGTLTTLSHVPLVPITLTGAVEQEVVGRTFATQTGSWTTNLLSLSLSGPVQGHTATMELDSAHLSTGITSITPISGGTPGGSPHFQIDSFFDVFLELSLDTLSTTRGPIHAAVVPEPSSIAVIAMGLLGMLALRRRRGTAFPDTSGT